MHTREPFELNILWNNNNITQQFQTINFRLHDDKFAFERGLAAISLNEVCKSNINF